MKVTTSTVSNATTEFNIEYVPFNWTVEGTRLGYFARVRQAVLILLGKRRSYPICICAFGHDEEES